MAKWGEVKFSMCAALEERLDAAQRDAKEAEAYAEDLEAEVERLKTQCEGLMQAAMNNGQALILAEAKLAKAVEALQNVIGEYDLFRKDEYERGLAPLDDEIHEARTTLAELTGGKDE